MAIPNSQAFRCSWWSLLTWFAIWSGPGGEETTLFPKSHVRFIDMHINAYTAWLGSLLDQSTTCTGYNNLISMRSVLVFCLLIGLIQFFRIENQSTWHPPSPNRKQNFYSLYNNRAYKAKCWNLWNNYWFKMFCGKSWSLKI